jgi:hypothetical protein
MTFKRRTRLLAHPVSALALVAAMLGGGLADAESSGAPRSLLTAAAAVSPAVVAAYAKDCRSRERAVRVSLSRERWPHIADHVGDVERKHKWPAVLHLDRGGADTNREQSLDHWEATKGRRYSERERKGKDRDEMPPAVAREGGRWKRRDGRVLYADVRLVDSGENRSAGAYMGNKLESWCDGQAFRLVVVR